MCRLPAPALRTAALGLPLAVLLLLTGCARDSPVAVEVPVALLLTYAVEGAPLGEAFDQADDVRITLAVDGLEPIQRTVELPPGEEELAVDLTVPLEDDHPVTATVEIEVRVDGDPLFRGAAGAALEPGGANEIVVALEPVPAGVAVEPLSIDRLGVPVPLEGAVVLATGHPVPGEAPLYSTEDDGIEVTPDGQVTARANGTYTVIATYRELAATGTVEVDAGEAPSVEIRRPSSGSSYASGYPIGFEATANDPEEGDVSSLVRWSSDLEGDLGSGPVTTANLSTGTHTVTASVTDTRGQSASDAVRISVVPPGSIPLSSTEIGIIFDLRSLDPGPPFESLTWWVNFSTADPVTGGDELITLLYGDALAEDLVQVRNDTDLITEGGTVYGPLTTANPIYDPMLDGLFTFGFRMDAGTAILTSITVCGNRFPDDGSVQQACWTFGGT